MTDIAGIGTAAGDPDLRTRLGRVSDDFAARMPGRWQFAAAVVGAIVFMTIFYFRTQSGWDVGSDLRMIYDRAGDAIREGGVVYWRDPRWNNYYYAPPLAVLFATLSWLPLPILHGMIVAADLGSARIITGAWWSAFALGAWPIVALEVGGGNINLIIGAAIVLAVRDGPAWPLAIAMFGKITPLLALHPRDWRQFALTVGVLLAITLPWAGLWVEWVRLLIEAYGRDIGPMLPVPFPIRLVLATVFMLLRRPWSRAAAAIVAIPAFYWGTLIYAPIPFIVWWRGRSGARTDAPAPLQPTGPSTPARDGGPHRPGAASIEPTSS